MYCKNCGTQNADGACFCKKCGTAITRPSEPPPVLNNNAAPPPNIPPDNYYVPPWNSYPAPPQYGQPYAPYPAGRKKIQGMIPAAAAAIMLIIVIITFWLPWYKTEMSTISANLNSNMNVETSILSGEAKYSFSECLFHEGEYKAISGSYGKKADELLHDDSTTVVDRTTPKMKKYFHLFKYSGLVGYVLIALALVCLLFNRTLMTSFSFASAAAFVIAVIGDSLFCAEMNRTMENNKQKSVFSYSLGGEATLGLGIILALAASAAAAVLGIVAIVKEKKSKQIRKAR